MIKYKIKYYEDEENLICICVDKQLRRTAKYVGIENMRLNKDEEDEDEDEMVFFNQDDREKDIDEDDKDFQSLKNELMYVHGMEELLSIRRHRLIFNKGDIFKPEEVVHDVLMVLLQNFDNEEGIAKEIETPVTIDRKGNKKKDKRRKKLNSVKLYAKEKKLKKKIAKKTLDLKSTRFHRVLFYLFFIRGNSMISRRFAAPVSIITSRSMPRPSPAVGGIPYSSASMKSLSYSCTSLSPFFFISF